MKILENKKEIFYFIAGFFIFLVLFITVIVSFRFIVAKMNMALNQNLIKTPEAVRFNLDLARSLGVNNVE